MSTDVFERLFEFIQSILDLFKFWVVVEEFESGVVLRLGKYHRHLKTGVNWLIPFAVENYYSDNVVTKTDNLVSQSLSTKDDHAFLISAIIKYRIRNIRRWLLEVEDAESVMADMTYSVIAETVEERNWDEIRHSEFRSTVHQELKRRATKQLGVDLVDIQFCDLSKSKALRLIND